MHKGVDFMSHLFVCTHICSYQAVCKMFIFFLFTNISTPSFCLTVKAGGMRIVQHKGLNPERPAKDAEDCTGLTVS